MGECDCIHCHKIRKLAADLARVTAERDAALAEVEAMLRLEAAARLGIAYGERDARIYDALVALDALRARKAP
jgi:hypothetical protein